MVPASFVSNDGGNGGKCCIGGLLAVVWPVADNVAWLLWLLHVDDNWLVVVAGELSRVVGGDRGEAKRDEDIVDGWQVVHQM